MNAALRAHNVFISDPWLTRMGYGNDAPSALRLHGNSFRRTACTLVDGVEPSQVINLDSIKKVR
jgi:hypothetical protein